MTATTTHQLPRLPDRWWQARPVLQTIRQAARARLVAPDAVLGGVLARVGVMLSGVALPPLLDDGAGLRLKLAVVGPTGCGKSGAVAVSRKLLPPASPDDDLIEVPVGYGGGGGIEFYRPVFGAVAGGCLYVTALDRDMPDVAPDWPGPVDLPVAWLRHVVLTPRARIRVRVDSELWDDIERHDGIRLTCAALLAVLDRGQAAVTRDDWLLAGVLVDTSWDVHNAYFVGPVAAGGVP